jgi:hypothetical protein
MKLPAFPWYAVPVNGRPELVNVCSPEPSPPCDFTPVASMVPKDSWLVTWLLKAPDREQELERRRAAMRQIAHCRNPNPCHTCMAIARESLEAPVRLERNPIAPERVELWNAIHDYAKASYGGTERAPSGARADAVVRIEAALEGVAKLLLSEGAVRWHP